MYGGLNRGNCVPGSHEIVSERSWPPDKVTGTHRVSWATDRASGVPHFLEFLAPKFTF